MTLDWPNVVGLFGSALFVCAFAYANHAERFDKLGFNFVNLLGAICLLYSLSVHFNLAAFVLETAWAAIALVGLISALRVRHKKPQP
jgi:hypothetical protein